MHQAFAAALDARYEKIVAIQQEARTTGYSGRLRWPAIVLRTPKGWTGPREVDGFPVEATFRAHQVPIAEPRSNADHRAILEQWLRSYRPEELFDSEGRLPADLASLPPGGVPSPATVRRESTCQLGNLLRDVFIRNERQAGFRIFCPDELTSNRLNGTLDATDRLFLGRVLQIDDHLSSDGRVLEVLSERLCEGWLEVYLLTGRHGLYVTYEAFAMISASMTVQHTKWLEAATKLPWRERVAALNILLTSTCWRNDHNGFSHQGPGLIDVMLSKRGDVARIYLPPDGNCLLSVADHCLRSNYVNLIVIDNQPQLQG